MAHPCFRPAPTLKMSRFFLRISSLKKCALGPLSIHSAQCQVELGRLGNQLPVLDKANSLWENVQYVFCLFVTLRLSLGRVGPGIKISRVIVVQAKSVQHLLGPLMGRKKKKLLLFTLFRPLCPAFSFADVDTYEECFCRQIMETKPRGKIGRGEEPLIIAAMPDDRTSREKGEEGEEPMCLKHTHNYENLSTASSLSYQIAVNILITTAVATSTFSLQTGVIFSFIFATPVLVYSVLVLSIDLFPSFISIFSLPISFSHHNNLPTTNNRYCESRSAINVPTIDVRPKLSTLIASSSACVVDYGCKKEQVCRQIMETKPAGKRGPEPLRQSQMTG